MSNLSIMYSSGLDSFIMHQYARAKGYDPVCIYLDLGHPYAEKEKASMLRESPWQPKVEVLDMRTLYSLIQSRLSNQIIPGRNLLLATVGAMFSGRVWLGALDGEQLGKEHDKSPKFFNDATALLTYTNEFFTPETIVEAPFANMSKSETIRWALDTGVPLYELFATSTCYSGEEHKCGKCLSCVKRYMAFLANDIEEPGYEANPLDAPYFHELRVQIPEAERNKDYSRFTPKRIREFNDVMQRITS